jgi:hypothetical protein
VRIAAGIDHLYAELVPENPRVIEERLSAGERMEVRAANADAVHAYERFTCQRTGRRADGGNEAAGLLERDLEHARER